MKFWNSCLFSVCVVTAVIALSIPNSKSLLASAIALYFGVVALAKPYTGFDETAHVDMMNQQFQDAPVDERPEFWKRVAADMMQANFPQLHGGIAPKEGSCPHAILGSCGYSEGPQNLYRFYYVITRPFLDSLVSLNKDYPWDLRKIAILFNIAWVVLLFVLSGFIGGRNILPSVAAVLILYGGALSQFATITNDVPMTMFGVLLAVAVCSPFIRFQRSFHQAIGFAVLCVCWWGLHRVDRSSLTALPLLLSLPFLINFSNKWRRMPKKENQTKQRLLLSCSIVIIVIFFTGFAIRWMVLANPFDMFNILYEKFPDTAMVKSIGLFPDFGTALRYLGYYFRSYFGSFIWGHSYYHLGTYLILATIYAYFCIQGIKQIDNLPNRMWLTALAILGKLYAIQLVIILAVAVGVVGFSDLEIIRDSYLKTRLTAPGTASIMTFLILGFFHVNALHGKSLFLIRAWALILLTYYGPKFYLVDAL